MCWAYAKSDFASVLDIKTSVRFRIGQQSQWWPCLFLAHVTFRPTNTFSSKIKLRGNKYIGKQIYILGYSAHMQKRHKCSYLAMELPAKLGGKPLVLSTISNQLGLGICWVQNEHTRSECKRLHTPQSSTLKGHGYMHCQYCICITCAQPTQAHAGTQHPASHQRE